MSDNGLHVGIKVVHRVGSWHSNPSHYKTDKLILGTIMEAIEKGVWHVLWDNGHSDRKTCHPSFVLKNMSRFQQPTSLQEPMAENTLSVLA